MKGKHVQKSKKKRVSRGTTTDQYRKTSSDIACEDSSAAADAGNAEPSVEAEAVQADNNTPTHTSETSASHMDDAMFDDMPEDSLVDYTGATVSKKSAWKRKLGIFCAILVALAAILYGAGVFYFSSHFYPASTMGTMDISQKSTDDVAEMLSEYLQDYRVTVSGLDFTLVVEPEDLDMSIDKNAITHAAVQSLKPWQWPYQVLKESHDMTSFLIATVDDSVMGEFVHSHVDEFNAGAEPPTDAYLSYREETKTYQIESEKLGTQIDPQAVMAKLAAAVVDFQPKVTLDRADLLKADIRATDERFGPLKEQANALISCDLELLMAGHSIGRVNADVVHDWIVFDGVESVSIDNEALSTWTKELAGRYNTVGTERTYTRPDGKVVTVSGGVYGWTVNMDSLLPEVQSAIENATVGTYDIPCYQTGNGVNLDLKTDWAAFCDVDLTEQHARYYNASGELVWESDVVTGTGNSGDATPPGVHVLNNKAKNITLKGPMVLDPDDPEKKKKKPQWSSPVAYWMPFIGNAYGLHDATWQSAFGGQRYLQGFGSHGCVNLPLSKAEQLFGIIQVGDPVIVHW